MHLPFMNSTAEQSKEHLTTMNLSKLSTMNYDQSMFIPGAIVFLSLSVMTMICSIFILTVLLCHWHHRCRSIINLLSCNTCIILLFHAIAVLFEIPLLFNIETSETFCRIRGYFFLSSCVAVMNSYLIQAISRYMIIIHYRKKYLLSFQFNILLIILSWIASVVGPSLLLLHPTAYRFEPETYLCVLTSKIFTTSFTAVIIFFSIPSTTILLLYLSILFHTTWANINQLSRLRIKRNMKVYQNIFIHMIHISLGGTPYMLLVILNAFIDPPRFYYLVAFLSLSIGFSSESITMFFTNQDVKAIITAKLTNNRVQHITVSQANQMIEMKSQRNENHLEIIN